jgi:hypothetical protein
MIKSLILVLILTISSFSLSAKTIVISDLDDTLRKAHGKFKVDAVIKLIKGVKSFKALRDIFIEHEKITEASGEEIEFYYVSASFKKIYNAAKWVKKQKLPAGPSFQRSIGVKNEGYKVRTISELLDATNIDPINDKVYFYGDNSDLDPVAYLEIVKIYNLQKSKIFIRDIKAEATRLMFGMPVKRLRGVQYFLSEAELLKKPEFYFVSNEIRDYVREKVIDESLIPKFVSFDFKYKVQKKHCGKIDNIKKRIACIGLVNENVDNVFSLYYLRF